jgi:P-type Ca2+ transporter type 2C
MSLQPVDSKTSATATDHFSDHLPYHAKTVEDCLGSLKTTLQGLNDEEAETRKNEADKNALKLENNSTPRDIFIKSLKKYISLLFVAAAALSFAMGKPVEGILIIVAMLANSGVQGLIQWKSLKPRETQDNDGDIRCSVRRNGKTVTVNASELVMGDILLINGGQIMPADARMISSYQIQVDESLLTGESVLVPKNANEVLHPLEDVTAQVNMLFAGTMVKTGKGEAMVTAMGRDTVMGKIATLAKTTEKRESPFTKRLNALTFKIFLFVLATSVIVIATGSMRGIPILQLFQVALVMGIAAFPETIPGLASLILSLGVSRLNDKKVHIKSFEAIETIGDVQVICTDKTGTLTENYLIFEQLFMPMVGALPYDPQWQKGEGIPNKAVEEFLRIGRLNNGTMVEGLRSPLMGDPIDVAIYRAAPPSLESGYHQRVSIPFDPVTLRSATLCETPSGQVVSMIKGAPESVIETCKYFMKPDGSIGELSITQRSEFLMFNRKLAYENNLRVIGFAQKPMVEDDNTGPYSDAIFMGWACLLDPAKPGVVEAIEQLQRAKTKLIMITGDQKPTAEITARELGIIRRNSDEVWLRSDLEAWEEPKIPDTVRVFARTKPEEKLAIVESLQRSGNIVAMVGDGVNDSPALQKSDVAIAMGMQGSDAAKESADIILMNDRLEGIVQAILESRILRRKIQSCMRYLLSCNLGLILFVTAAMIGGLGLPINVIQMLWLNLVIVSIPSLVLAVEPVKDEELEVPELPSEGDTKNFKAKKSETTVSIDPLDQNHLFLIFFWGALMMVGGLCAYLLCTLGLKLPVPVAGTTAFCTLALIQTLNLFNVQALNAGENRRAFMAELTSTPITWIVLAIAMGLQVLAIYVPGVNTLLGTTPLPVSAAIVAAGMGIGTIIFSLKTMKI